MSVRKGSAWPKQLLCGICALLTAYALLCSLQVQAVSEELSSGFWQSIRNILTALWKSMPAETLYTTLVFAGLYWLMNRFLRLSKSSIGEWLISLFTAVCMLAQKCYGTDEAGLRLLTAYRTQLSKGLLCYAGFVLLALTLLHLLDEALVLLRQNKPFHFRHPMRTPFLIILACWIPAMILRYPGVLFIDTFHQIMETERGFGGHNPPVLSWLYGQAIIQGNAIFGKAQVGIYVLMLLQCVLMALVMAKLLFFLQRRDSDKASVIGLLVFFAVSPVICAFMTTHIKDSAYTICFLLFFTETAILLLDHPTNLDWVLWTLSGAIGMWTRQNAVAVMIPAMLIVAILQLFRMKIVWKKLLCLACAVVAAIAGIMIPRLLVDEQDTNAVRDILSLPIQTTARILLEHPISPETYEYKVIDSVVDVEKMCEGYDYYSVDNAKRHFRPQATQEQISAYLKVWTELVIHNPLDTANAILGIGSNVFSPIGSAATLYWNNYSGYVGGEDITEWWNTPLNVPNQILYELWQCCMRMPLGGIFSNTGLFGFIMLWILKHAGKCKHRHAMWILTVPFVLTLIVLVFSPIVVTRYALPLIVGVPAMTVLVCADSEQAEPAAV